MSRVASGPLNHLLVTFRILLAVPLPGASRGLARKQFTCLETGRPPNEPGHRDLRQDEEDAMAVIIDAPTEAGTVPIA